MLPALYKRKSERFLKGLPSILVKADKYFILNTAKHYHLELLKQIKQAKTRIYLVALYVENDEAGAEILQALYEAKKLNSKLDIAIIVDWNRAQRGRIGETTQMTNANFYHQQNKKNAPIELPFYGVPINYREVLGVLHLKGAIVDETVLYTGASINNVYLDYADKYRLDRYHIINDALLADSFVSYIQKNFFASSAVTRLDVPDIEPRKALKTKIKALRAQLSAAQHTIINTKAIKSSVSSDSIHLTPLAGLGKNNQLNKTILHLVQSTQKKLIICTPYFNFPQKLTKSLIKLLSQGCQIEIIVGDKTANDFYIPENEPFKAIGGLPYLYEMNLRRFAQKLQRYLNTNQLVIRLWKDLENTYHLKGIWSDEKWMLITGNNLNPRGWRLDLENGILVHDPDLLLKEKKEQELAFIREKTMLISHYQQIQASRFYPKPVKVLIKRLSRIKVDKIIKHLL